MFKRPSGGNEVILNSLDAIRQYRKRQEIGKAMRSAKGKLQKVIDALVEELDVDLHGQAISVLRRCRTRAQLDALAGAWLSQAPQQTLRLVCHGGGTYLVVHYDDGWTRRLAMVSWPV